MNSLPPEGGAAVEVGATADAKRDGNEPNEQQSPTATATTTSSPTQQPNLKLRNDRGHVELSSDGFCKVSSVDWGEGGKL